MAIAALSVWLLNDWQSTQFPRPRSRVRAHRNALRAAGRRPHNLTSLSPQLPVSWTVTGPAARSVHSHESPSPLARKKLQVISKRAPSYVSICVFVGSMANARDQGSTPLQLPCEAVRTGFDLRTPEHTGALSSIPSPSSSTCAVGLVYQVSFSN